MLWRRFIFNIPDKPIYRSGASDKAHCVKARIDLEAFKIDEFNASPWIGLHYRHEFLLHYRHELLDGGAKT